MSRRLDIVFTSCGEMLDGAVRCKFCRPPDRTLLTSGRGVDSR